MNIRIFQTERVFYLVVNILKQVILQLFLYASSSPGLSDNEEKSEVQAIIESTPELDMDLGSYKAARYTGASYFTGWSSELQFEDSIFCRHFVCVLDFFLIKSFLFYVFLVLLSRVWRTWHLIAILSRSLRSSPLPGRTSLEMWMRGLTCWVRCFGGGSCSSLICIYVRKTRPEKPHLNGCLKVILKGCCRNHMSF